MIAAEPKGSVRIARPMGPLRGTALVLLLLFAGGLSGCGGGSSPGAGGGPARGGSPDASPPPRLAAEAVGRRLPAPLSGEAAVSEGRRVLIIGGVDSSDVSTSSVLAFDPSRAGLAPAGELSRPLHDVAAVVVPAGALVFGGGSSETTDTVERLRPGSSGTVVGRLPRPASDLSAVRVGASAVVIGGYDGTQPLSSVLRTADGRSFSTVAQLPVPVRYASLALGGGTIFVLGGELADGLDSDRIQAVDLADGTASVVGRLPGPLSHASSVELGGRTYLLGGRLAGRTTDQILRFRPGSADAVKVGRLPSPVQNAAAASVGRSAYLFGGLDSQGTTLSTIERLRLVPR